MRHRGPGTSLIVTADDFGMSLAVNEAVEEAHRKGILCCASLMMTGEAVGDAVERARRLPGLEVGLHVCLTEGRPVAGGETVLVLLGPDRLFKDGPAALGMRFAFLREVRRAVAGEVKAQVEAFLATGLPLTYMDAHHHLHIHPGLFPLLLREGKPRGLRGIRVPVEPWSVSGPLCRPTPLTQLTRMVFGCLGRRCMHRARALDLITADGVFGLYATGRIGRTWVLGLLERLRGRQGLFELYTHPSYASDQGRQELRALTDRAVRTRLRETGIRLGSYTKA